MGARGPTKEKHFKAVQTNRKRLKRPDHLIGYAAEEWDRLVGELRKAKLLHEADRGMIENAAMAYGDLRNTQDAMGERRFTVVKKALSNGEVLGEDVVPHPGLNHIAKMMTLRKSILESLGLCSTKRARKIDDDAPQSDDLTNLLAGRGRASVN